MNLSGYVCIDFICTYGNVIVFIFFNVFCYVVLVYLCVVYSKAKDKFPLEDNKGTKQN